MKPVPTLLCGFPGQEANPSWPGKSRLALLVMRCFTVSPAGLLKALSADSAQTAFEYLLVAGVIVVAIALVVTGGFGDILHKFLVAICSTVDPVGPAGQCLGG